MDSAERLAEIKARLAVATPGPWEASVNYLIGGWWIQDEAAKAREGDLGDFFNEPDAQFCAHARQDLPWAVARIEALEEHFARQRATDGIMIAGPVDGEGWRSE